MASWLARFDHWLRAKQDPRYGNAPWFLPRAWHGGDHKASDDELQRLQLNMRDIGLDPVVVVRQPHNQFLLKIAKRARE